MSGSTLSQNLLAPTYTIKMNGVPLSAETSTYVQRISVVSERDSLDQFDLTLANTYPDMRWTNADRGFFAVGNSVTISMGYVNDTETELMTGEITQLEAKFPNTSSPTMVVHGRSKLHRLTRRKHSTTFTDMSDTQIVKKIAADHGLTAQVEQTKAAGIVHSFVAQRDQSDLEFLRERAGRLHFEVHVEDKNLIFRPADHSEDSVVVLQWGQNLMSFHPTISTQGQVSQVTVRGYDPVTKKKIEGKFKNKSKGAKVAEDAFGPGEEMRVDIPIRSQQEADGLAEAIASERSRRYLTARGTTIGVPSLRAGQAMELKKVGQFDGKYRLTRVTHDYRNDGYTTKFEAEWFE